MSVYMKRFIRIMLIMLAVGLAYAGIITITGFGIPCFFRMITGWQCPGCGVSRMCLRILEFKFEEAFYQNPFLFCTFPFIFFEIYMYCRYGMKDPKWNKILDIIYIVALITFGVARNIVTHI